MAARRRGNDRLVLRLGPDEAALLERLLDELDDLATVAAGASADPVAARLHVAGYADPDEAAAFRELTHRSLQGERRERYAQCRAELSALSASSGASVPSSGGELVIEAATISRWLMVFNDMRLALGTRLGVTDTGFAEPADGAEPSADAEEGQAVYHWLTAVQDGLVTAAMG